MPSHSNERISPYLKIAISTVLVIIITAIIAGIAVWMTTFAKPPDRKMPDLVGMKFEQAQQEAAQAEVKLIRHDEFNDRDPDTIYRSDWEPGRTIRPGRSINVWVSRGSRMVWVPNVLGLNADEAMKKLKDAGLALGALNREVNNKVPYNGVIEQNPRAGKRVNRELAVNLRVSDGPKPGDEPVVPTPDSTTDSSIGNDNTVPSVNTDISKSFNININVKRDGLKRRRVKVEYEDSRGVHTPVDEDHEEGDQIAQKVDVYGPQVTIRVYYGDDVRLVSERTIQVGGR